jgi:uncharacterized protein YjiK
VKALYLQSMQRQRSATKSGILCKYSRALLLLLFVKLSVKHNCTAASDCQATAVSHANTDDIQRYQTTNFAAMKTTTIYKPTSSATSRGGAAQRRPARRLLIISSATSLLSLI